MRNLSVIVLGVILITACSDKKEATSVIEKQVSNEEVSPLEQNIATITENEKLALIGTNELIAKSEKDLSKQVLEGIKRKNNTKNLMINKQKFELQSEILIKGAKVYNVLMSETGIVKGTFVVITNNVENLSHFDKAIKFTEIAKDTYRLKPEQSADFLDYYNQLQKVKQFQLVEMEIDYSGKTGRLSKEER